MACGVFMGGCIGVVFPAVLLYIQNGGVNTVYVGGKCDLPGELGGAWSVEIIRKQEKTRDKKRIQKETRDIFDFLFSLSSAGGRSRPNWCDGLRRS